MKNYYLYIGVLISTLACQEAAEEEIATSAATQQVATDTFDPFANTSGTTIDSSSGFYDYNQSTGTVNPTGTTITNPTGTTTTINTNTDALGNVNPTPVSTNGDLFQQEVATCNAQGNIYIRSTIKGLKGCISSLRFSTAFPCTLSGIVAEFRKINVFIEDDALTKLNSFTGDQCGYDLNNKPVALFVNSDYSSEELLKLD